MAGKGLAAVGTGSREAQTRKRPAVAATARETRIELFCCFARIL
jgi:hypothetical protein